MIILRPEQCSNCGQTPEYTAGVLAQVLYIVAKNNFNVFYSALKKR